MNPNTANVCVLVSPLQGWNDLVGALSQGVALGWRVVAPLARHVLRYGNTRRDLRANGALTRQPRATPWELGHPTKHQP